MADEKDPRSTHGRADGPFGRKARRLREEAMRTHTERGAQGRPSFGRGMGDPRLGDIERALRSSAAHHRLNDVMDSIANESRSSFGGRHAGHALRAVILEAFAEARALRARTVEAEHLLLALSAVPGGEAAGLLSEAGLDHAALVAALRSERAHGLGFAGVEPLDEERLRSTPGEWTPAWGASMREALVESQRAAYEHGHLRGAERNLLVGILQARLGTVPRALAFAGVDREGLMARALSTNGDQA